jgi:CHAT domain-containing protein
VYEGNSATPHLLMAVLPDASHIHFACHGVFDHQNPLDSALMLAPFKRELYSGEADMNDPELARILRDSDGKLHLGDIIRELELKYAPLVVLSACHSGLAKFERLHEEYIGFPAGFLYAGGRAVISTLWKVNDVATWLLMRVVARELAAGREPSQALRFAQQELKALSKDYIVPEILKVAEQESYEKRRSRMLEVSRLLQQGPDLPFASPYWWAGFTISGLT